MPRCARSTTSLVWGIPVHPTHLLRAIRTHKRLLPTLRALRGCHLLAPDPPRNVSHDLSSSFTDTTPSVPFTTAARAAIANNMTAVPDQEHFFSFTSATSAAYPLLTDHSTSPSPINPATLPVEASSGEPVRSRKGISSLPAEILDLIEAEVRLSAHEEDVPRTLVDTINEAALEGQQHPGFPGWRRICVCGERYEEPLDVMKCWENVMAEVGGRDTQQYLLKYFGLTTAVISMPLKHAIVLLVLPPRVSTLLAPLTTTPSLPMHPPISKHILATYPSDITGLTGGRLPRFNTYPCRLFTLPPAVTPLVIPSDDFISHLHPGMFAQNHWRLRNQNSGLKASVVDPAYLSLTKEMVRRVWWCVEELVLWKAVRIAREELGYEELACIEHFHVSLQAGTGQLKNLTSEGKEDDCHEMSQNLERLQDEGKEGEKRAKVGGDMNSHIERKQEGNYWSTVIRPALWLLEELAYEP